MEGKSLKRKAKNKQWYKGQKKRKFALCPDIKGFLLFCNHKEKEAIREAYNLLNQYADRTGSEEPAEKSGSKEDDEDPDEEEDLDAQLEREKTALEAERAAGEAEKRFQVVESGAQNVLFIRTTVPDPVRLVTDILDDIRSSGQQKTRHLIRLLPIGMTCKAYEPNVKSAVETLISKVTNEGSKVADEGFKVADEGSKATNDKAEDKAVTYQVLFKARCNQNLFKDDVIKIVREAVPGNFRPDLKNPDLCFVFEVIKSNCCVGILPDYFGYKKYNLIELAQTNKVVSSDDKKVAEKQKSTDETPQLGIQSAENGGSNMEVASSDDKEKAEIQKNADETAQGNDVASDDKKVENADETAQGNQSENGGISMDVSSDDKEKDENQKSCTDETGQSANGGSCSHEVTTKEESSESPKKSDEQGLADEGDKEQATTDTKNGKEGSNETSGVDNAASNEEANKPEIVG